MTGGRACFLALLEPSRRPTDSGPDRQVGQPHATVRREEIQNRFIYRPHLAAAGDSDSFDGYEPPGADRLDELAVVSLVLVGVASREKR